MTRVSEMQMDPAYLEDRPPEWMARHDERGVHQPSRPADKRRELAAQPVAEAQRPIPMPSQKESEASSVVDVPLVEAAGKTERAPRPRLSGPNRHRRHRYVRRRIGRDGEVRFFYSRGQKPDIPLLAPVGTPAFEDAWVAAHRLNTVLWHLAAKPIGRRQCGSRSMVRLAERFFESADFLALAPGTQRVTRRAIKRLLLRHQLGDDVVRRIDKDRVRHVLSGLRNRPSARREALLKLRGLMRYAIALGWRTDDPTATINLAKRRARKVHLRPKVRTGSSQTKGTARHSLVPSHANRNTVRAIAIAIAS